VETSQNEQEKGCLLFDNTIQEKAWTREYQHFSVKLKWDPSDFSSKNLLAVNACGCPSRPAQQGDWNIATQ